MRHDAGCEGSVLRITVAKAYSRFAPQNVRTLVMLAAVALSGIRVLSADSIEDRVNDLRGRMTLEEKLEYIGGIHAMSIRPIPRLGLPEIGMNDGPVGGRRDLPSTRYPAGSGWTAPWNPLRSGSQGGWYGA